MFAPTTGNPDSYLLNPTAGGSQTIPFSATLNAAGTVVTLSFDTPRDPTAEYELIIDPSVADACGLPLQGTAFPLHYEIVVMPFSGKAWKYDHSGVDLVLTGSTAVSMTASGPMACPSSTPKTEPALLEQTSMSGSIMPAISLAPIWSCTTLRIPRTTFRSTISGHSSTCPWPVAHQCCESPHVCGRL